MGPLFVRFESTSIRVLVQMIVVGVLCVGMMGLVATASNADVPTDAVAEMTAELCAPGEVCECFGPGSSLYECYLRLCPDFPLLDVCTAADPVVEELPPIDDIPPDDLPPPLPPPLDDCVDPLSTDCVPPPPPPLDDCVDPVSTDCVPPLPPPLDEIPPDLPPLHECLKPVSTDCVPPIVP